VPSEVKAVDEQGRRYRVEGVPFFIVNGTLTLSAAQPSHAFLEAFTWAVAKNQAP
jgi:predicted DsbA family dithiol-disulfide isomerase